MLILSISADTFPLSFLLIFPLRSSFSLHLVKRKQPALSTPLLKEEREPIQFTNSFNLTLLISTHLRFWRESCFRFLRPSSIGQAWWFLAKSRGVLAKLNLFFPLFSSLSLSSSPFFFSFLQITRMPVPFRARRRIASQWLHGLLLAPFFFLFCFAIFRPRLTWNNRNKRFPDSSLSERGNPATKIPFFSHE